MAEGEKTMLGRAGQVGIVVRYDELVGAAPKRCERDRRRLRRIQAMQPDATRLHFAGIAAQAKPRDLSATVRRGDSHELADPGGAVMLQIGACHETTHAVSNKQNPGGSGFRDQRLDALVQLPHEMIDTREGRLEVESS